MDLRHPGQRQVNGKKERALDLRSRVHSQIQISSLRVDLLLGGVW